MFAIIAAIFPVFALIGAGALFGRMRKVGPGGVAVLNGFTVSLALPALLFRSLAAGDWRQLDQPAFVLAFDGGVAITFLIAFFLALPGARNGADRSLAALAASYSNTAFIGLPLMAGLIGPVGTEAAVIASLLTVSLLFAIAVLIVEIAGQHEASIGRAVLAVGKALSRNPLIVAPIAGGLWAAVGAPIPLPLDRLLTLLAAAASPTALVTIGAFLALPGQRADPAPLARCIGLKLLVQPAVTGLLVWLLPMPRAWAVAAILLAALPTGTGPFMLAELYGREAALASRTILISTMLSAVTIAVLARILI